MFFGISIINEFMQDGNNAYFYDLNEITFKCKKWY